MTENHTNDIAGRELGRRSVIKGAAWSVPVIAAAVATPFAAATGVTGNVTVTGGCLPLLGALAGGHQITNNSNVPVTLNLTQVLTSNVPVLAGGAVTAIANLGTFSLGWQDLGPGEPSLFGLPTGSGLTTRSMSRTWTVTLQPGQTSTVYKLLGVLSNILGTTTSTLSASVTSAPAVPVQGSPAVLSAVVGGVLGCN